MDHNPWNQTYQVNLIDCLWHQHSYLFSCFLQDGRLEAGDQILSVNENGLVDVTQTQ